MDARTLSEVMGGALSLARYQELLPAYLRLMQWANINTVDRAAMLAAQLGHESVGLKYQQEIHDGSNYEGRRDLGNVYPGDGRRFRGHGWIQVTGRGNHTAVSKWAHEKGLVPTPTFFVDNPAALGDDQYCWVGPAWYWTVARPQINSLSDARDLEGVTRAINGGTNGLNDRRARYQRALTMGAHLLTGGSMSVMKGAIPYPRDRITQDTYYNCGPASAQTIIIGATGQVLHEVDLGRELRTHQGGTDWIGQFPAVLNQHIPGAQYQHTEMPNDPPTEAQKQRLWDDIVRSVDAQHGVVANIVAPPSNYPRAVPPSTINPAYSGGTVYHYIAVMGYEQEANGFRKVWVADSGFRPFEYWLAFDQLATLIPPKGYAHSVAPPKNIEKKEEDFLMALTDDEQRELLTLARSIDTQLQGPNQNALPEKDRNPKGGRGWRQLGSNATGQWLTLVDALAHFKQVLADLVARVDKLEKGK